MESTVYKTDFSYFVRMALENNIPWKTLAIILKELNPTLIETREVIGILLKELETLHLTLKEKDKELKMYQNVGASVDTLNLTLKPDAIQENMQQSSKPDRETIEDEIEVLEVVKERIDEEMYLEINEDTKLSDNDGDLGNGDESVVKIDNSGTNLSKMPNSCT